MEEGGGNGYVLSATLQLKDQMSGKLKSTSSKLKELGSAAETAGQGVSKALNQKISPTLNNEIKQLSNNLSNLSEMRRGEVEKLKNRGEEVRVNVKGNAESKLKEIQRQVESLSKRAWNVGVNIKNAVGSKVTEAMNGAAMGIGAQMIGTAGAAYAVVEGVKTYKDFEYEMATVQAISGANEKEREELTRRAKELGASTLFKASEVAKAEEYMAMAGWKTEQIVSGLPAVLDLATASGEDLARVSDIVTDSLTAFGLKSTDIVKTADGKVVKATDHFADVMTKLATTANTNVSMAGETAKYSAAVVGSLYSSQSVNDKMRAVEDWAQITGIMANAGIKGSMAGTAQRAMLTRLASMQQNANAARQSLGVNFVYEEDEIDEMTGEVVHKRGQTRRLSEVIEEIRAKFAGDFDPEHLLNMTERLGGKEFNKQQRVKLKEMIENVKRNGEMSDANKATLTSMLSGQEGMAAWLSVLMAQEEEWSKSKAEMANASGSAKEKSKIKMDTLQGDIDALGSAWEAVNLAVFEGKASEGLRELVQGVTEDIRTLQTVLKDGFDISDIGTIIAKVVTQLKDKFLAFDGIGSFLAGGALIAGLKKVYDWTIKVKDAASRIRESYKMGGVNQSSSKSANIPHNVNTLTIHANNVIVNGKVNGQNAGSTVNQTTTNQSTRTSTSANQSTVNQSTSSKILSNIKSNVPMIGLTGALAIMDIASTRGENAEREAGVKSEIEVLKAEYEGYELRSEKGENERIRMEAIKSEIGEKEKELRQVQKESAYHNNESLFGGIGGVLGGLALSAIPGVGPILAAALSIAGGFGGTYLGKELSHNFKDDVFINGLGKESPHKKFNNDFSSVMQPRFDQVTDMSPYPQVINKTSEKQSEEQINQQTWTNYSQPVINQSSFQPSIPQIDLTAFDQFKSQITTFFSELPSSITSYLTELSTSISTGFADSLGGVSILFSTLSNSFSQSFLEFPSLVQTSFNQISQFASDSYSSIQSLWSQFPSFFSSLWFDAAGAALTAGSSIATGINSAISIIQSAWDSLSIWLTNKITSLSSMASNAVSAVTSFLGGGIAHNASGTSNFEGGFTEINEHGGEIVYLPGGSVIYPHATTMRIIRDELNSGSLLPFSDDSGINNFTSFSLNSPNFPLPSFHSFSDSQIINNTNEKGVVINGGLNIKEASNVADLMNQLMTLLSNSNENYTEV